MTMFTVRLYEGVWLGSLVLVREGDGKVEGWEVAYRQEMGRGIDDMLIMWRGGTHACCEGDELPPGNLDDVLDGTLYDEVGPAKLMWGSDMPAAERSVTYRQAMDYVRLHMDFLSGEDKAAFFGGNAARLFGIDQ